MSLRIQPLALTPGDFFTGFGLGLELVTIDTTLPIGSGKCSWKGFSRINQSIQLLSHPGTTFLSGCCCRDLLGLAGWRWVCCRRAIGALVAYYLRRQVPDHRNGF